MMNTTVTMPIGTRAISDEDGRTVLFSFLSRADATPLDQRSRADGHVLGNDGHPVDDPAADPSALAFQPDPNLNAEHWASYWRKVHGVRFLHSDETIDEDAIARLLRYDQIHRFAAGPTSQHPLPHRPPLDADGKLYDTVLGHIPPYQRPAWDGVAYLQFASLDDLGIMLGTDRIRRKILPEDRALFRDLAPLLARQHVLFDKGKGGDGIILVKTHRRSDSLDRVGFQTRWLQDHAALVIEQPATLGLVRRYIQLHNIGPTEPGEPFYHPGTADIDGVTLMAFGSIREAERFLLSESYAAIEADENKISPAEQGEFWTGVVLTVADRSAA